MATARIRGPSPPISAQIELTRAWAVIEQTERALIDSELLPAYQGAFEARTDRDDQDEIPRGLAAIFPSMASGLHAVATTATLRRATAVAGASTDRTSAAAYDRQLSAAIGIPVVVRPRRRTATVSGWVREATGKIVSVREDAIPGLRAEVERAWARRLTATQLEERLRSRGLPLAFGTVEGRTAVIARDQIGKLNGRLTELRHRAMGVTSYRWRHSADSRVRPSHRRREGRLFSWNRPPSGGHPGEPVQCRCSAEAVVDIETAIRSPEVQRAGGLGPIALAIAAGIALTQESA